jgi:hypothetical protein
MVIGVFHITELGFIVYSFWIISSIWIIWKKRYKFVSIIFPFFALVEGLFIDWRWGKLNLFDANYQIILGGMPSFLIAIGFPFVGFYLHYIIPKPLRFYLSDTSSFPFSVSSEFDAGDFSRYYKTGSFYSFTVLFLHELSQLLNISSRNTFDIIDLIAIIVGSTISKMIYLAIKTKYNTNASA